MGVVYCDGCGMPVDLDLNLEDYNFKTKLCLECESDEIKYPIIHEMPQGSPEWIEVRRGMITASHFKDVMAKGAGATRTGYMKHLCMQRRQSIVQPGFKSKYMDWGTEYEDEAILRYELQRDCTVEKIGFVQISDWIGSSPDGRIRPKGMVEAKCPGSPKHFDYLLKTQKNPNWYDPSHKYQMQGNMWCLDLDWCDWISYDPRFTDWQDQIIIVRVPRDQEIIDSLEAECKKFQKEATEILNRFPKTETF